MAGGTFLSMNKVRPGAYINFESVPKATASVGARGIVTFPAPLSWGPQGEIIELYSTDLTDGKSLAKIGVSAFDSDSLIFRQALSHAYLAYVYRIDTGGTKASVTEGDLTVTAKYAGETGNRLSVVIRTSNGAKEVATLFSGVEVDIQKASTIEDLLSNDWVEFSGTGALPTTSIPMTLAAGSNGIVSASNYAEYFASIKNYKPWNTMAVPSTESSVAPLVKSLVKELREQTGRKVQAVAVDYPAADYEGIISVDQGYRTATEEVDAKLFAVYVAGLTAGSEINKSNTYHKIEGAVEIISPKDEAEIEKHLKNGQLVLSRRQDGGVVIEQDINTFNTFAPDKGYEFSKNRVIRTIDGYANDIQMLFENSYIGKVDNTDSGRNIFKADIIQYLERLQGMGAIQNFDSSTDVILNVGNKIDEVVLDLWIQPADAMEKLYNRVYLTQTA